LDDGKRIRKRILISVAALVLFVAVFFYVFSPGVLLGGVRAISLGSEVRLIHITSVLYEREGGFMHGVAPGERTAHYLSDQQIVELRRLLRGTWFVRTRMSAGGGFFSIDPPHLPYYVHSFVVQFDDTALWFGRDGSPEYMTRIRNRSSRFRVVNADFQRELLYIIGAVTGGNHD
jgi:hypothetical protein